MIKEKEISLIVKIEDNIIEYIVGNRRFPKTIVCHFNTRVSLFKQLQGIGLFKHIVDIDQTDCTYRGIDINTSFEVEEEIFIIE